MTQAIFQRRRDIVMRKQAELVSRGVVLWRECAVEYRTLPFRYLFLMREKRLRGITPLRPIQKTVLEEYPEIPWFSILEESEMKAYLRALTPVQLSAVVNRTDDIISRDYSYRTMRAWVAEANYQIYHKRPPKTPLW